MRLLFHLYSKGSFAVFCHIAFQRRKEHTAFIQIVLGLSCYDMLGALAWVLAPLLAPRDGGAYQAIGNDFTCKLQGALLQVGLTSMFYNLALVIYFLLVIRYGWKEDHFSPILRYLHLVILVVGFASALGGIPLYGTLLGSCYVSGAVLRDNHQMCTNKVLSTSI